MKQGRNEKSSKKSTRPDVEKRKKLIDDASGSTGKEIAKGSSLETQEDKMKYNNIQPTASELAVIQVPPDGVDIEKSPLHTDHNEEDSDDFSPTPHLQPKKKHDASGGPSLSPPHKKCK
ncbi:uncharacterized protein [Nicotiana tomentosiformis]|uniref:uncharacterized protein n=1 Tax=Nicotiana tomentosiformis TaxID=4098 RepID=UPI00388C38C2